MDNEGNLDFTKLPFVVKDESVPDDESGTVISFDFLFVNSVINLCGLCV